MSRCSKLGRRWLACGLVLLAMPMLCTAASAQQRPRVEIVPFAPHSNYGATSSAISPDGKYLLSGGDGAMLKLWDAATGRLIRTFAGHSEAVNSVAFSPDSAHLLSGSQDRTLKLWDPTSGRVIRTFEGHSGSVSYVAFSPDGTRVLSGSSDKTLKLWDAASGHLIRTFEGHREWIASVGFSPDGTRLISGSFDRTLKLWDAASGQTILTVEEPDFVLSAVFSPDGTRVLLSVSDHKDFAATLRLRDAASGQLIRTFKGHSSIRVHSVKFSPDGTRVLSGSDDATLKLWDAATGQLIRTFENQPLGAEPGALGGHDGQVLSVAYSSDGTQLVSNDPRTLRLWDVSSGRLIRTIGMLSDTVHSVQFSPDGTHVVSAHGGGRTLKLWDAVSGRLIRIFAGTERRDWMLSVAFSPNGTRLVSGTSSGTVKLWDVASGQQIHALPGHSYAASSVAFSPDGTRLLSGSYDNTIRLWDGASAQLMRTFKGHSEAVRSVAFSSDGRRVISGSADTTLKLWDAATGQLVRTLEGRSHYVNSVAFSPDGTRLLSGHGDNTLKLWDAASGQLIRAFEGHRGQIESVGFSPDGTRLISGSFDSTLKVWDAASGQLIRTLEGHSGRVYSAAFSPDGARLISGSSDGTSRVWSAATGEVLATLLAARSGEWLVITPEGFFEASGSGTEMLGIVTGLEVYSIDQFYQVLYRPDLVQEKLAGDRNGKVREAAARLDLSKLLDSGRVPSVAITSHKAQDKSPADLVTVEARLADQGGGIGRAEWRINGITVGLVEKAVGAAGQLIALKQAMALDPGDNTVELVAYNSANLVASVPARAKITWTGSEPTAPPRLYVLAVGINDYLDSNLKLTYAVPDAKSLAAALSQAGQGHYEEVIVTHALDGDATAAKLDEVFKDLAAKVRPRDVFLFFAAGHGKTLDGRYYFLPHDLRYHTDQSLVRDAIGQDKLQAWFARILAKKAVLMFDTCEAGSLTERKQTRGGLEQKASLGRLIQATGRATLTASTATQEAYEGHGGHGVFTFALLDALARADLNNNGLIELAELIQHVDGLVPAITEKRWGARQFPQMDAYGSNFPLARQVVALAPASDGAIVIPIKPTHVSTELLQIFKEAGGTGAVVEQLPPFSTVTLVKVERGWMLIAKDGRALGYVAEAKLHKLN